MWRISEEVNTGTRQKKKTTVVKSASYFFWVLHLVVILYLRKLRVFSIYGFPEENSLCLLSLVMCLCLIVVLVILSVEILI